MLRVAVDCGATQMLSWRAALRSDLFPPPSSFQVDLLSNHIVFDCLRACGACAAASSEEDTAVTPLGGEGYAVAVSLPCFSSASYKINCTAVVPVPPEVIHGRFAPPLSPLSKPDSA